MSDNKGKTYTNENFNHSLQHSGFDDFNEIEVNHDNSSCDASVDNPMDLVEGQSNWYHAGFHIFTAVVGTGVLGLSQAFSLLNIFESVPGLFGIICLLIAFVVNYYASSCLAVVHTTNPSKAYPKGRRLANYIEVSYHYLGKKWTKYLIVPFQVINLASTSIAYLIVSGQNTASIFAQFYTGDAHIKLLVWITIITAFQFVLALFPSLESFRGMSAVGSVVSCVYSLIAIVLSFDHYSRYGATNIDYKISSNTVDMVFDLFVGLSTMAFLFGVQSVQPDIQHTLKRENPSSQSAFMKGLRYSYLFTIPLYVLSGLSGYLAFGSSVSVDILVTISSHSNTTVTVTFITIAQVCVVVHTILAYQVWSMPMFNLAENWVASLEIVKKYRKTQKNSNFTKDEHQNSIHKIGGGNNVSNAKDLQMDVKKEFNDDHCKEFVVNVDVDNDDVVVKSFMDVKLSKIMVATRYTYILFTWFIAILLPFFGDVMAVNGSVTIVPLCFVCPIIFKIKRKGWENIGLGERVLMSIVIIAMSIFGVLGTIASFRQLILDASTFSVFQ